MNTHAHPETAETAPADVESPADEAARKAKRKRAFAAMAAVVAVLGGGVWAYESPIQKLLSNTSML